MKKYTIEEVKNKCKEFGINCLSESYSGVKDKLKIVCSICNNTHERSFDNILIRKNDVCYICSRKLGGEKQSFNYEYVKNFIETESECILISKSYKSVDEKLDLECYCGDNFKVTFYKFNKCNKKQCTKCGRLNTKYKLLNKESDIIEFLDIYNYTYLERDISKGDQRILVQCNEKHNPYWVKFIKFKHGRRCPHCKRSLGEEFISNELKNYDVSYNTEQTFHNLKGIGGLPLRYDFSLIVDDKIIALIEYDGLQHFEVSFDDEDSFIRTKEHDEIKNKFAEDNYIPLYRIAYDKYHYIPQIIENILKELKIIK